MNHVLNDNKLMRQLDLSSQHQLLKQGDWIALSPDQHLNVATRQLGFAYFPTGGAIALIMQQRKDKQVALTMIGQEGMVGVAAALGVAQEPYHCVVLSAGNALQISVGDLYALKLKNQALCTVLDRYVAVIHAQFAQAIVCHSCHDLQQRMACLLLNLSDRVLALTATVARRPCARARPGEPPSAISLAPPRAAADPRTRALAATKTERVHGDEPALLLRTGLQRGRAALLAGAHSCYRCCSPRGG